MLILSLMYIINPLRLGGQWKKNKDSEAVTEEETGINVGNRKKNMLQKN